MSAKHYKDQLSEYLDGELPAAEAARVKNHLSKCAECKEDLGELKRVAKAVSSLPKKELPPGFIARLYARRRREETAVPASQRWGFPVSGKMAALALTSLLACFIFFRQISYRMLPDMPGAAMVAGEADIMSEDEIADARMKMVAQNRRADKTAARRGTWSGTEKKEQKARSSLVASTARMLEAGAKGRKMKAEAPAKKRRSALRAGAPVVVGKDGKLHRKITSNEDLRDFLGAERDRMGIREIIPRRGTGPKNAWDGIRNEPMGRRQAKIAMRQMTRNLAQINERARWNKAPSVPIGTGATPRILGKSKRARSGPIAVSGAAGDADLSLASGGSSAGSIAYMRAPAGVRALSETRDPAPKILPTKQDLARMRRVPSSPVDRPAKAEEGAPAKPFAWRLDFDSAQGGMGAVGGALITNSADWSDLLSRVRFADSLPAVDFSKELAIGVFASRDVNRSRRIRVVSVSEENGLLVVRYRITIDAKGPTPSAPYHIIIIPTSKLRPSFIQVP